MATAERTKITKPSPIVEDEQGQLRARQGISREVVAELSKVKDEPDWMADKRLKSLEIFERKPVPTCGPAARSCTCPRASRSTCRCRRTSAWRAPARAPSSTR